MDLRQYFAKDGPPHFLEVRGDEVRRVEGLLNASEGSGVPDAGGGFQKGRGVIWKNREREVGEESGGAIGCLRGLRGKRHHVSPIRCWGI